MKKLSVFLLVFVALTTFSYAEQLKVTPEHPFYLNGEWIEAKNLKIGDKLKTIDGKTAVIKNIRKVETNEPITVYNLEDDFYLHNYVVGNGLVVHNSKVPSSTETVDLRYRAGLDGREPGRVDVFFAEDAKGLNLEKLAKTNLRHLFKKGFKGVAYRDSSGKVRMILWSGEDDVHHMDVVVHLLKKQGIVPEAVQNSGPNVYRRIVWDDLLAETRPSGRPYYKDFMPFEWQVDPDGISITGGPSGGQIRYMQSESKQFPRDFYERAMELARNAVDSCKKIEIEEIHPLMIGG